MDNNSIDSSTVDKLITKIIKLEKNFVHENSMSESKKRNKIRNLIEDEVKVDVD